MQLENTFKQAKAVSTSLGLMSDDQRNEILNAVATAIIDHQKEISAPTEKVFPIG